VIQSYTKPENFDLKNAKIIWQDMIQRRIIPSNEAYLNMFTIYYENSDTREVRDEATAFWNDMVTRGIQPDEQAYGDMIGILWSNDDLDKAVELWKEMRRRRIPGSRDGYCYMISLLGRHKFFEDAEVLWEELFELGMEPHPQVFENLMLYYYSERKNAPIRDKAIAFWEKNRVQNPVRVPDPGKAYPLMIGIYMEDGDDEGALQIWEEMKAKGIEPTRQSLNYMIVYFVNQGDWNNVKRLWKELRRRGFQTDENTQYLKYMIESQEDDDDAQA